MNPAPPVTSTQVSEGPLARLLFAMVFSLSFPAAAVPRTNFSLTAIVPAMAYRWIISSKATRVAKRSPGMAPRRSVIYTRIKIFLTKYNNVGNIVGEQEKNSSTLLSPLVQIEAAPPAASICIIVLAHEQTPSWLARCPWAIILPVFYHWIALQPTLTCLAPDRGTFSGRCFT